MPKDPRRVVVENLFLIQRYANSVNAEVQARVHELFNEIAVLIVRIDPMGLSLQRYRTQRARKLFKEIEELTGATFDEITKHVRVRLAPIGKQQGDVAVSHLKAILGAGAEGRVDVVKVTINQVKAIVDSEPVNGALLRDWFKGQADRTAFQVQRQIRLGMVNAETIDDMVRRVRGRSVGRGRYAGGVMQTTSREAEAIIRTSVTDISNRAALETFRQNADITTTYEYTATLDSRTTLICANLDGQTFKYDDPAAKQPPQHVNCRSIVVPNVDWEGLGLEPPAEGTRASAGGQVAASTTYEPWLKSQPASVQDEILGPSRGRLFREGRIDLRDMVRTDGRRVPLDELVAA